MRNSSLIVLVLIVAMSVGIRTYMRSESDKKIKSDFEHIESRTGIDFSSDGPPLNPDDFKKGSEIKDGCEVTWQQIGKLVQFSCINCSKLHAISVAQKLGYKVLGAIGTHKFKNGKWETQTSVKVE